MNAFMSRVLPTPVASAKQSDGNSFSKSVTDGNSLRIVASAAATSDPFFGGTISVTRSRISSECRCGGRRLRRAAMVFTWRFIKFLTYAVARLSSGLSLHLTRADSQLDFSERHRPGYGRPL